jgi:glycosyltransferase involved in cell wall biosynthesis
VKVLVVTQYFWPESFRINDVVSSLVDSGIEVDVLTGKPNYPDGKIFNGYRVWDCQIEHKFGSSIFRVPLIPRGNKSKFNLALNYFSFIIFGVIQGAWMVRKNKYDLVFVYGLSPILLSIPGVFISKTKGIHIILWVQDLWPESLLATKSVKNGLVISMVGLVVKWIYQSMDLILVQSHAFIDEVKKMTTEKDIKYYPNSVDPSFYNYSLNKQIDVEEEQKNNGKFNVVFAGNVGIGQGIEVILEAAKILSDIDNIQFVIYGSGSRLEWLEEQKKQYNLKGIILKGRHPVESMPQLLSNANALLVTLSDEAIFAKTIPNKIQAYLAVGRPILACLNGEGARVVNEAKAGIAVPAGDSKRLSEAILNLYKLPEKEMTIYGKNGREYYEKNFKHEKLIKILISEFENLIKNK